MTGDFSKLRAVEQYAQYWWRETADQLPSAHSPHKHPYRSIFTCDRDRVMYCSAFRRLSSKTQIFTALTSDNLRTRLTHTLEVAQIARTISDELGLNSNLVEAIALAHDLGHTPFGHVGERTINQFSKGADKRIKGKDEENRIDEQMYGFKHNLQSIRVLAEYSENVKFSNFLYYGIREHSKRFWKSPEDVAFYSIYDSYCSFCEHDKDTLHPAWSFEAFVVKWSDEIAQRHHDLEDAYLQKIMPPEDILEKLLPLANINQEGYITNKYERLQTELDKLKRKATYSPHSFLHTLSSFLVDSYVTIFLKEFRRVLTHFCNINKISTYADFENTYCSIDEKEVISLMKFSEAKISLVDKALGNALKYGILDSYEVQKMDGKGAFIIRKLLRAYISNPQQLPDEYIVKLIKIELKRNLKHEEFDQVFRKIAQDVGDDYNENIDIWKVYEYREALRIIKSDACLEKIIYGTLLRVVFDYVAGMTDTYAEQQYKELY